MKAAWIFPQERRCGIGFYSKKYVAALRPHVEIVTADPSDYPHDRRAMTARVSSCDIVHIQYETSLFQTGAKNHYAALCSGISPPIVVSLHEVYSRYPGVYDREAIRGRHVVLWLRRLLYDIRHPSQTTLRRHRMRDFNAKAILVHADYHRSTLCRQGVTPEKIHVVPHPVTRTRCPAPQVGAEPIHLGATGFVNPNYDYDLLFECLEKLELSWRFTWVGGTRRDEDGPLLESLRKRIAMNGWGERFRITGWVSDEERDRMMQSIDIYCALFKDRSSSESLATAIGLRRMIVATRLPLTEAMLSEHHMMKLVRPVAHEATSAIQELATDGAQRDALLGALDAYVERNCFEAAASRIVSLYRQVLDS